MYRCELEESAPLWQTYIFVAIVAVMIIYLYYTRFNNNGGNTEQFLILGKTPPPSPAFENEACARRCDNTQNCLSSYYDAVTQTCYLDNTSDPTIMTYPRHAPTYYFTPSKYRYGKMFARS